MTPEREIRVTLKDGSEVIMNTGDRVLFQASSPGAIPLSVEADTIIDDVLAALEEAEQQNKRLEVKLQASRDSVYPISVERDEYKAELAEAQQTIERAIKIFETADMETDFDNVLHGMYEALKGVGEGAKEGVKTDGM